MKRIVFALIILSLANSLHARKYDLDTIIQIVYKTYEAGDYDKTLKLLDALEKRVAKGSDRKQETQGLVEYWRGLTYSKLNEYELSIEHYQKAIENKYKSESIHYELAQAYYISDRLLEAKMAFKNSVKAKYKRATSLYYMAFISQQLNDSKKAASYFNAIDKLPDEEKKDVVQAARLQLAEMYLAKVEQQPNSFKKVEEIVIPQYQKALDWDKNSTLAIEIKDKIEKLQRKYDLVLFKMRNGRPTARPPYLFKTNLLVGTNGNVNLLSEEAVASANYNAASPYTTVGAFGRYSYYPNSIFSFSPEFQFGLTKFLSNDEEIYTQNYYSYTFGLKTTYEHIYNNAAATLYFDIQHNTNKDDADGDKTFEDNYTMQTYTLSEEFQYWRDNPSTFRLKIVKNTNVDNLTSFNTNSLIYEQLIGLNYFTVYTYWSYDSTRFPLFELFDTNASTFRTDFLFSSLWGLFNPNIYISYTGTTYVNDVSRDKTAATTYGINLSRPLTSNSYVLLNVAQTSQTGISTSDVYKKQDISLNFDYFY